MSSLRVFGRIDVDDLIKALRMVCPHKHFHFSEKDGSVTMQEDENNVFIQTENQSQCLTVSIGESSNEEANKKLKNEIDMKDSELKEQQVICSETFETIKKFQKQQSELFDDFVLLRQKYDKQKDQLSFVLWTHCLDHHPDLKSIPIMKNPELFEDTLTSVGSYKIVSIIGEGLFATVKLGVEKISGRQYALKMIKKYKVSTFNGTFTYLKIQNDFYRF